MSDNAEQAEFWNGRMGTAWVSVEDYIDRMLAPISAHGIAAANAGPGDRVIDIGCGHGTTSLQLATSGAAVWGVDISEPMIESANKKIEGRDNIQFSVADAANQAYTADHSLVFSRFGVMFFSDPESAFANIRTALAPNGRLVFLCWQLPSENPWLSIPGKAVQPFQPADTPPPDPEAPGPFRFGVAEYTENLLTGAGFKNVKLEAVVEQIHLGDSLDEAMTFQTKLGALSGLLETLDEEKGKEAIQAVRDAFAPFETDDGLNFEASAWLVTATA